MPLEMVITAGLAVLGLAVASWSLARSVPAALRARVAEYESVVLEASGKVDLLAADMRAQKQELESFLEAISEKAATIERKRRSTAAAAARANGPAEEPQSRADHLASLRRQGGLV